MSRYKKATADDVAPGKPFRVRARCKYADFTVTYEGKIERLSGRKVGGEQVPDTIEFDGYGAHVPIKSNGSWDIVSIEAILPDLPTTPGSVVETDDEHRAAVLRRVVSSVAGAITDSGGSNWQWADGSPGGPTWPQLNTARIIYTAHG